MSYVVLARKYRPKDLEALVGQAHIERALRNAIEMDRVAHALLFCGARGTGKTSTARILARMLNCATGPTATPCGSCAPCVEIAAGTAIDVHELDAASNRGINEIRELREGVGYAPARDRNKIYIIDEAHMLTTDAANAFLKTLEEPPPRVFFILATTDPQRLPITIRSRCQRYDFRRIRAAEVVGQLRMICTAEGVDIDDEALWLVAREGDGSMRDALSVLDQVIAFGGARQGGPEVAALLGVADRNRTASLVGALVNRDTPAALAALAAAHHHGIDLRTFARTLALEARDLLVIRLAGTASRDLVDRSESEVEAAAALVADMPTAELERLAQVLLELAEQVAKARHPRLVLELGVVRLCRAAQLVDVAELSARVEGLLRGAGAVLPQLRASAARIAAAPAALPTPHERAPMRSREARTPARTSAGEGTGDADGEPAPGRAYAVASTGAAAAAPVHAAARTTTSPRAESAVAAPPGRSLRDADLDAWRQAAAEALADPLLAAHLDHAVVIASEPGRVKLAFANAFHADQAGKDGVLDALARAASRAFGGSYRVEHGGVEPRARTDSIAARARLAAQQSREAQVEALRRDPAVAAVVRAFDGVVSSVATAAELRAREEEN